MINSLAVRNFRCFRDLELSDLRRVNVVVGKNATGKTALLEAIRLALGGTPNVLWLMNQTRGNFAGLVQPVTKDIFESFWSPYFFNFESAKSIFTECQDNEGHLAALRVFYDMEQTKMAVPPEPQLSQQQQPPLVSTGSFTPPLAFERLSFANVRSTLYASISQGNMSFDGGPEIGPSTEFFPSSALNPQLAVQMFSQLSLQQREIAIVDAVRDEFEPSLESLAVLSPSTQPGIYAGVRYLKQKLPIGNLSAGITRFVAMLSAVLLRSKGLVLIDEIENGLSYRSFPALWKYLLKFAIENDTQLFASTHSLECVRALTSAMNQHENEFTLLRAERINGSSGITLVPGEFLEAAIDQGVEVR
jgi:energy-coupling factor transporter ATP-binding protein EcfA2